jgi:polyisoprenoid-binding protein YceI
MNNKNKQLFSILKPTLLFIAIFFISTGFAYFFVDWNIDPNYNIKFTGVKSEGSFSGLTGKIVYSNNDLAHSSINVSVDVNSIKTGNDTKDNHAKGSGWLDAKKYSKISFVSTSFQKKENQYVVIGILELHGVRKEVTIPFKFDETKSTPEFSGEFDVNMSDYGVKGGGMGFMMDKKVRVSLRIPVAKK